MSIFTKLRAIRKVFHDASITPYSPGLTLKEINRFEKNKDLNLAVDRASEIFPKLLKKYPNLLKQSEMELIPRLQKDFLQFYDRVVRFVLAPSLSWAVGY